MPNQRLGRSGYARYRQPALQNIVFQLPRCAMGKHCPSSSMLARRVQVIAASRGTLPDLGEFRPCTRGSRTIVLPW